MAGSGATRRGLGGELAERVAWSMVAALAARVGAGLALAIGSAVVPALCPNDDGTCGVGWLLVIGALGYLLALLPACAIGGLGIWFWVAYVAGVAPLLVVASIGDWWWWAALVLLPPLAAAVSWPFGRPRITNWHRWVLVGAAALTVGYAVWWYAFAN